MFTAKGRGGKIREFRKRNKLTQTAFAKQTGTGRATLSKRGHEKINLNPGLTQIIGIAKVMGIPHSTLLSQGENTANASVEDTGREAPRAVKKQSEKNTAAAASAEKKCLNGRSSLQNGGCRTAAPRR